MISLQLLIDGTDRTLIVQAGTIKKDDNLDNTPDLLSFNIESHSGQGFIPAVNSEVVLMDGATKIFGGYIVQIDKQSSQDLKITTHKVTCKDYSHVLDRGMVLERFENTTVNAIIAFLILKYASSFDTLYVNCPTTVTSITFNNISFSAALNKLSKLTNYQWYVDYDKHLHFYLKGDEPASFGLTDGNGNYIPDTLTVKADLTQIRNRVKVVGGETQVNPLTYTITGAKGLLQTNGRKTFPLAYKFADKPTVTVGTAPAVTKLVGVVGIDNSSDFDVMWSFEGRYLDFAPASAPGDTTAVSISGTPLEKVQVRVQDSASILAYGLWDQVLTVPGIASRAEALQYANAELAAYKDPQYTGQFDTYTSGLRAGQSISINSTKLGLNDSFLIQKVSFKPLSYNTGYWTVQFASLRQLTLTDILGRITGGEEVGELSNEALLSYVELDEAIGLTESAPVLSSTSPPYYIWPSTGSGSTPSPKVNFFTIAA